eukprot:14366638-Alexandrium_andersonii.AAC.1
MFHFPTVKHGHRETINKDLEIKRAKQTSEVAWGAMDAWFKQMDWTMKINQKQLESEVKSAPNKVLRTTMSNTV